MCLPYTTNEAIKKAKSFSRLVFMEFTVNPPVESSLEPQKIWSVGIDAKSAYKCGKKTLSVGVLFRQMWNEGMIIPKVVSEKYIKSLLLITLNDGIEMVVGGASSSLILG